MRDKHARDKYLEVSKYPEMILVDGEGKDGTGTGRIKWRGFEKDVKGTYTVQGDQVQAMFPIQLSEFGIKNIKYMGVGVDDTVKISVRVPLKK